MQNYRSQNQFKHHVKNICGSKGLSGYRSLEKTQSTKLNNWNNSESVKKVKRKKKISKKRKIANLQSKLATSLDFNKFNISKSIQKDKNFKVIKNNKNAKIKSSQLAKKLTSYDISMKKNIKRYTPAIYPSKNTIEVKQLDWLNMPATARHIYSSSNSKESIGESSIASNIGLKIDTKTLTEEGTRETSCNKDSNLFLGSFEVPESTTRIIYINDQTQGLNIIKDKVVQTLNSYRSYCSTLQKEMMKLKIENQKLKDMLL